MRLSFKHYAQALHSSLLTSRPQDEDKILDNFAQILAEAGLLGEFEKIADELLKIDQRHKGQIPTKLSFADENSAEKKLLNDLNLRLGGNRAFQNIVDNEMIGGIIIESDDELIDGSVKKQLEELKKTLTL